MLKRFCLAALAALALIVTTAPSALAANVGTTAQYMHAKSPLRFHVQTYTFSTTANITAATVGVVPPGGAFLKDVVLLQNAAGTGGTSWVATPKKSGTALVSTAGGFTLAAGASKTTNVSTSPMGALTNPTGGTRPVLDAAQITGTGGEPITIDVTLTGTYTVAVSGAVLLFWEPKR